MEFSVRVFLQEFLGQPISHREVPLAGIQPRLHDGLDNLLHTFIRFLGGGGVDEGSVVSADDGGSVVLGAFLIMELEVEGLGDGVVRSHEQGD